MGRYDSRANPVPKKLEPGMAVVIYIRSNTYLLPEEREAGFKQGQWCKCVLIKLFDSGDSWQVKANGCKTVFGNRTSIIIRSTAYADNHKPRMDNHNKQANQARAQRRAVASVKPL